MVVDLTEVEDAPAGEAGRESETASLASLREALARKRKERREAERKVAALREEEQDLELLIEGIEDQEESARRARNRPDWAGAFKWDQQVERLLAQTFRLPGFRPLQREVINATLSKWDTLVLMPTGGGKSLVYMLPALVEAGVTLVVSPLISLMHDQVTQLAEVGVRAELLCQHTDKDLVKRIHDDLCSPKSDLRLLYATPERVVKSKTLISRLEKAHKQGLLQRIVIDEAHCISQWGHDWRQDYTKLGFFKKQFPEVPIMALTATATRKVEEDIKESLHTQKCERFCKSVDRPNLQYEVQLKAPSADEANQAIYDVIAQRFPAQPGIVYCFSKKEAETVAHFLQGKGVRAKFYHADLDLYGTDARGNSGRMEVFEQWSKGRVQVVVATIAFGMGINKLDVRFVIHHTMSKSISAYYQEAGRAGRCVPDY
jgi:ATP-dependent DNA helicase Q1